MQRRRQEQGFTLIEMLLVLAISGTLIMMLINFSTQKMDEQRRDRTVLQMQQIMNAALAFYVNNSMWPVACGTATWTNITAASVTSTAADGTSTTLTFQPGYIPPGFSGNPYGQPYLINCSTQASGTSGNAGNFYVSTSVGARPADAMIIAGRLPMAYINTAAALSASVPPPAQDAACATSPFTGCTTLIASVTMPGQNLNNARSINFAGIYYSGSCVPAPDCPPGMSPSIIVAPAGVSGIYDYPTCSSPAYPWDASTCDSAQVIPISSFSAYARGRNALGEPGDPNGAGIVTAPYSCDTSTNTAQICRTDTDKSYQGVVMTGTPAATTLYWRVCLRVVTEQGIINPSDTSKRWVEMGKMMGQVSAFTRCVPNAGAEQPSGSFNVYQR